MLTHTAESVLLLVECIRWCGAAHCERASGAHKHLDHAALRQGCRPGEGERDRRESGAVSRVDDVIAFDFGFYFVFFDIR